MKKENIETDEDYEVFLDEQFNKKLLKDFGEYTICEEIIGF